MNVYDFDKTIYVKDSSIEFYRFSLIKRPLLFFKCFPKQIVAILLYKLGIISKKHMKEIYFSFLKYIDTVTFVDEFTDREIQKGNIAEWYKRQQKRDDVVISASPEFLVEKFANKLGINHVIASKVDPCSGSFFGENCHGEEKVKRFKEYYQNQKIEKFYSDSNSDEPMALIAMEAFLVSGNKINQWKYKK